MTGSSARPVVVAALLLAAVGATGCGGGSGPPTTTGPSITQIAPPRDSPVVLREPDAATVLRGRGVEGEPVALSLRVSGTSAPQETILVKADCRQRACQQFVLADDRGAFATTLTLALHGSPSRLTVGADYATHPSPRTAARARAAVHITRRPAPRSPEDEGGTSPPPPTAPEPPSAGLAPLPAPSGGTTARRRLIVIGDSLAVGMRPYLAGALGGWQVSIDGRVGRPLAEGMAILAGTTIPDPSRTVLAMSLFTNDDPRRTGELSAAIARSLRAVGRDGCVVWATIARPPLNGVSYAAANRTIETAAARDDRLRVVDWAAFTSAHPGVLARDRVHPIPDGYRQRAAMYAQAAASCR